MRKLRLSELRKTYDVLNRLDTDVPKSLLVYLSDMIQETEQEQNKSKRQKDTKQALGQRKTKIRKLRVIKSDGILIKEKSNLLTYMHAIVDAGIPEISNLDIKFAKQNIVIFDMSQKKKLIKGYKRFGTSGFIRKIDSFETQFRILNTINRQLNLKWKIGY